MRSTASSRKYRHRQYVSKSGLARLYTLLISSKLVRKQSEASQGNFELELENLAILKYLRHPSIVELLGAYTHDSKHNLIFPKASSGDLADLFKKHPRPAPFVSNDPFLIALAELSSAISAVHNFAANNPELARSGCHHDLKPRNILVDGAHFILADFGLTRLKPPEQTSEEEYKIGEGYYIPPECQDLDAPFLKHTIRRSSDIWSFGCIIAEVLTYMMKGAEGVQAFMQKRKFKVGHWKFCYFHSGDVPNAGVVDWLSCLEHDASQNSSNMDLRSCGMLIQLVRRMLAMVPDDRPKAFEVEVTLYFIALEMRARRVARLYSDVSRGIQSDSIEAFIEEKRFESWRWVLAMVDTNSNESASRHTEGNFSVNYFVPALKLLGDKENALNDILSQDQPTRSRVFLPLRQFNHNLLNQLPQNLKTRADSYLQLQLLESEDETRLGDICNTLQHISADKRLGILAAMKRMTILTKDHPTSGQPQLDPKPLIDPNVAGEKVIGWMTKDSTGKEQRVLVEWKHYEGHWKKHGPELLERVAGIAQLLAAGKVSEDLCILYCSGFYHAPDMCALGLVFEFPPSESDLHLITLRKLFDHNLQGGRSGKERKPMLGSRFKLAYDLAASILEFHKVGWLHRSISSSNIAFFASSQLPTKLDFLEKPYIVNFVHSRPNEEDAFTEGPQEGFKDYQHPVYLQNQGMRFRPEFDYYSIGVVLLELGLWMSIQEMTNGPDWEGISRHQFRERLLKRRVPQLGPSMGVRYRDAVKYCLQWDPIESIATSVSASLNFQQWVVEQLSQCAA